MEHKNMRLATITLATRTGNDIPFSFPVGDGKSTFELWLQLPGNEGKTMEDFYAATKGKPGTGIVNVTVTKEE